MKFGKRPRLVNFAPKLLFSALYPFLRLAVTYNNISGPGLVALSDAMKTNPVLSYIYIWGNKFDEAACVVCFSAKRFLQIE